PEPLPSAAFAIGLDGSGNACVTGRIAGPTDTDFRTVKLSPGGAQLWAATYIVPTGRVDQAYAIGLDGSGHVVIAGSSRVPPMSDAEGDYRIVRYDAAGGGGGGGPPPPGGLRP